MRIAVTSQNFRTVTGHAGRARRFIVFTTEDNQPPREIERLDLNTDMAIHGYGRRNPHPLDTMDVLITGSAGEGFVHNLAARDVLVVATPETDPHKAVEAFLAGRTSSASAGCNHDHGDRHKGEDGSAENHSCSCRG